jgi:hypothetical protein
MACVGCAIAPFNSVAQAAKIYGLPVESFMAELEAAIRSVPSLAVRPHGQEGRFGLAALGIRYPYRIPLLLLAILALLTGLSSGLLRLGWQLPPLSQQLAVQHGPLMVSGFLGSLISLERAVALSQVQNGRRVYYLAPLLAGVGASALLFALPPAVPRGLILLSALGLVLIFVVIYRLQPTVDHGVMGLGALLWLVGNLLWWVGLPLYLVVPWWAGFMILTIAGERLELSRLLIQKRIPRLIFIVIVIVFLVGLLLSLIDPDTGLRLFGFALIALGAWLLRLDIARRTIRRPGLTRFIATCLMAGYVWLLGSGLLWLIYGGQYSAGPVYDALLHTIFLGFVFSMIFGHAPVIFPAILGTTYHFNLSHYIHFALLHLSLSLRLSGDLLNWTLGRRWGGLLNEIALLLFLLMSVIATRKASR